MKRGRGLLPAGARLPNQVAEARLRGAWPFVVGPALAGRTRPLRVDRDILIVGCWELSRIGPLREAAAAVWPQIRDRIHRALGLRLSGIQIEPCDPPAEARLPSPEPDPLKRALKLLEARRRERIRLGLEPE